VARAPDKDSRRSPSGEPWGQRLPGAHRVRKRREFKEIQEKGGRYPSGAVVVMLLPNVLGHRRLGVTVSSKVGNAVVRARVKRWLREVFRKERGLLPESVDAVVIARSSAADAGLVRLGADFRAAAELARARFQHGGAPRRPRSPGP
jgi:ribonuclease P protein component